MLFRSNLDMLTDAEKDELIDVFTNRLGTAADFSTWSGGKTLLVWLRLQVGIADEAVQTKFAMILNDTMLDDMQKSYIQQIIDYAKTNGDITFMDLQQVSPFCDYVITDLFGDKLMLIKNLVNGLHKPVQ